MITRDSRLSDAPEISAILKDLAAAGKRTLPCDEDFVRTSYIYHPDNVASTVVEDEDGTILGLQILKRAATNNIYGVTVGWGVIGTHVSPKAARRGVARLLFSASLAAAENAGLQKIDATIGVNNPEGLAYYKAMGFSTYKTTEKIISKCYEVGA